MLPGPVPDARMLETAGLPVRFRRPLQENAPCSEKPVNISVLFPWREKGDGPTQQPRKRPRCCGRESRRSAPRKAPPNLTGRNSSPRKNGRGRLAQLVEYRSYTPTVRGSSPLPPTRNACKVPAVQRSAGTFLFGDTSGRLTNIPSPTGGDPPCFRVRPVSTSGTRNAPGEAPRPSGANNRRIRLRRIRHRSSIVNIFQKFFCKAHLFQ